MVRAFDALVNTSFYILFYNCLNLYVNSKFVLEPRPYMSHQKMDWTMKCAMNKYSGSQFFPPVAQLYDGFMLDLPSNMILHILVK